MAGEHGVVGALPREMFAEEPEFEPEAVLGTQNFQSERVEVAQVVIKWRGKAVEEAMWLDVAHVKGKFPDFRLEDKAVFKGEGVDKERARFGLVTVRGQRPRVADDAGQSGQQDEELDELSASVQRIGGVGLTIHEELLAQEKIIDELGMEMDSTSNRLDFVQKKVAMVMKKAGAKGQIMMILFLLVLFIVLFVLVFLT
ncbi:hypothetical protein OROGR_028475 [Orobanche gracilis]